MPRFEKGLRGKYALLAAIWIYKILSCYNTKSTTIKFLFAINYLVSRFEITAFCFRNFILLKKLHRVKGIFTKIFLLSWNIFAYYFVRYYKANVIYKSVTGRDLFLAIEFLAVKEIWFEARAFMLFFISYTIFIWPHPWPQNVCCWKFESTFIKK